MRRFWRILLLLLAAVSSRALEIKQVDWGFNGQVVPNRFNLVSVLVANNSEEPFDGAVNLYKTRGMEERVGATYTTPCYVSPFTTRWMQYYVYVDNQYDKWRLQWGRGADEQDDIKEDPKWGPPAQVFLSEPESALNTSTTFRQFPEELFPPTVAGTSGLDTVLLDHTPHWEAAQRQAFLNWLRAGGRLHLLTDVDGHYPVFSDELGVLNSPEESARIGAGLVVRHAATVRTIRKQDIERDEIPLHQFKPNEAYMSSQTADSFFSALAQLSRPRYSWGLIYLLAIGYVVLVGPGYILSGRRFTDYRLRIVMLLATVAGFAFLFNFVGRRGQGEASVVHTLSYAQVIDGDTYNVTQWINVFATHGADYTITHTAPDNLYATGQDYEAVNGWIHGGKAGQFVVDIPMFSRRAFLHEAEMKGAAIPIKILNWDASGELKQLTLTVGPELTKQIMEGWVVHGNLIYPMKLADGRLEFGESSQLLTNFLTPSAQQQFGPGRYYGPNYDNEEVINVEGTFRTLANSLIGWSLSTEDYTRAPSPATEGRAQLFLFARSPDSFRITGSQFGQEIGYVLYHLDLFKPGP